jgi:hypothetical protein
MMMIGGTIPNNFFDGTLKKQVQFLKIKVKTLINSCVAIT